MVMAMLPKSVLLVEDNSDDRFLTERILRKAGIDLIKEANDGQEALDILLKPDETLPEMVILDLRLPRVDGLKVFAELRSQERSMELPVLVLTSSNDPIDRETCLKLGSIAYLTKPLELSSLQQLFA
jgi:CheY-like chemotaxis protein